MKIPRKIKKAARHITRFELRKRDGISKIVFFRVNEGYLNTKWTRKAIAEAIREEKKANEKMLEGILDSITHPLSPLEIEERKNMFFIKCQQKTR